MATCIVFVISLKRKAFKIDILYNIWVHLFGIVFIQWSLGSKKKKSSLPFFFSLSLPSFFLSEFCNKLSPPLFEITFEILMSWTLLFNQVWKVIHVWGGSWTAEQTLKGFVPKRPLFQITAMTSESTGKQTGLTELLASRTVLKWAGSFWGSLCHKSAHPGRGKAQWGQETFSWKKCIEFNDPGRGRGHCNRTLKWNHPTWNTAVFLF